jgi:hypothetical protein
VNGLPVVLTAERSAHAISSFWIARLMMNWFNTSSSMVGTCKRISVVSVTCTILKVLAWYFNKVADCSKKARNVGGSLANGSIFSNDWIRLRETLGEKVQV